MIDNRYFAQKNLVSKMDARFFLKRVNSLNEPYRKFGVLSENKRATWQTLAHLSAP